MNDEGMVAAVASQVNAKPPLPQEVVAKQEERRRRRLEQEGGGSTNKEERQAGGEEDSMWENEYPFSSFKLRVHEEFGGESCVGGTQWPQVCMFGR